MHNVMNTREVGKWSVIAVKAVLAVLVALPKVREALGSKSEEQVLKPLNPLPTGQFGLVLLNTKGSVIKSMRFARTEVRAGFVNAAAVQRAALSVGAESAVLTYESPGLVIDNPTTYRDVVSQIYNALAEVDVRLLNRGLMKSEA